MCCVQLYKRPMENDARGACLHGRTENILSGVLFSSVFTPYVRADTIKLERHVRIIFIFPHAYPQPSAASFCCRRDRTAGVFFKRTFRRSTYDRCDPGKTIPNRGVDSESCLSHISMGPRRDNAVGGSTCVRPRPRASRFPDEGSRFG